MGKGAVESISRQLSAELPGLKGYSATNLKYMRLFYEAWNGLDKSSAMADDLQQAENQPIIFADIAKQNHPYPAYEMTWDDFFSLGFTLHMEILSKAKPAEERAYYIHQAEHTIQHKFT